MNCLIQNMKTDASFKDTILHNLSSWSNNLADLVNHDSASFKLSDANWRKNILKQLWHAL